MIARKLKEEILILAKEFPTVVILGPRQSGKTTLAKNIFKGYKYFSFEDSNIRGIVNDDPKGFLAKNNKNIIIDEAQRIPDLFSYIQTHVDTTKKNKNIILTGSHNYLMMESVTQSLAGRIGISTLFPLSLEELPLKYQRDLNEIIYTGFYPRIFDENIRPNSFYKTYLNTYLERDIRLLKNIVDYDLFKKFLQLVAGRAGQVLNMQSLAEDADINLKTAKSWLSILETSYIIYKLQPYYNNYNKRIIKNPKLYFYDTGLLCHLLGLLSPSDLNIHYLKGNIFENFIISDIIKGNYNYNSMNNFYFWKDNNNNEIDLIIETANIIKAIEIKSSQTAKKEFLKNLKYFNKLPIKHKKVESILMYGGDQEFIQNDIKIMGWKSLRKIKELGLLSI